MAKVALYIRVSTQEQAKSGYSIPEQRRALREYVAREGLDIGEEIVDDGYSGATLDRPGLQRIMELAESGAIDAAVAMKRDRWFRRRYYRLHFDEDLKECGARLLALDDTNNKIGDSVLDSYAEYERDTLMERARNGKIGKARAGKIVGGHQVGYGYTRDGDHYVVNEPAMQVVRRIFDMAAEGRTTFYIADALNEEGIPTPRGGKRWSREFLTKLLHSRLYAPYSVQELREQGLAPEVAERLDSGTLYGAYRYTAAAVPESGLPEVVVPVPVPWSGISRQTVKRARARKNPTPSKAANRLWELSGMVVCAHCGRRMQAASGPRQHYYYRCARYQEGKNDPCPNRRFIRAGDTESQVWGTVRDVMNSPAVLMRQLSRFYERERAELPGPNLDTAKLYREREKLDTSWEKYQRAYEADAIGLDDLKARREEIKRERESIDAVLEHARQRERLLANLDAEEAEIKEAIESGDLDTMYSDAGPEKRRELYRRYGVRVRADAEGELSVTWLVGEEPGVSEQSTLSGRRWRSSP